MTLPLEVRGQLDALVRGLQEIAGDELVGVYLHGSLTFTCFNPATSDVDLFAVMRRRLTADERALLAALVLEHSAPHGSAPPWPLEIAVLSLDYLHPWRHPAEFDLHFSESHREEFEDGRLLGPANDFDLAADITVVRETGVVLCGAPIADVFPEVPWRDYAEAIARDLDWCRDHAPELYSVLGPGRIWATLTERRVHSKESGAEWALERAPEEFRPMIARALSVYRGESAELRFDLEAVRRFADFVSKQVTPTRSPASGGG